MLRELGFVEREQASQRDLVAEVGESRRSSRDEVGIEHRVREDDPARCEVSGRGGGFLEGVLLMGGGSDVESGGGGGGGERERGEDGVDVQNDAACSLRGC